MTAHLSPELAQRIVERLDATLERNLNLMDATGQIIASGDPGRIGAHHPGAREALERGAAVEVHAATARDGERAGVNLPLRHRGRVIGVIGVTGDPDEVRQTAAVLELTIALMLDREQELGREARRDAQDRELLARLVHGAAPERAVAVLERRHADVAPPWVLHAVPSSEAASDPRVVAQLRTRTGPSPAIAAALRGTLWVLRSAAEGERRGTLPEAALRLLPPGSRVLSSMRCDSEEALVDEVRLLALCAARPELLPEEPLQLDTAALGLEIAAAQLPIAIAASMRTRVAGLRATELRTLGDYLATGSATEAAARGFTHRNTVLQRLARITRVTALDPRAAADASTLRLALVLHRERHREAQRAARVQLAHGSDPIVTDL